MITSKLSGGLGNQLFQILTVIGYSLKHNMLYCIPKKTINEKKWKSYRIGNINYDDYKFSSKDYHYREPKHSYTEIPFIKDKNLILDGYFQSYKYFMPYLPEIIKILDFKYEPTDNIAIHVRRGDYITKGADKFPTVTDKYLNDAIDYMNSKDLVKETTKFKFFSDDINWCKQFATRSGIPIEFFEFSEGQNEIQDFEDMHSCAHQITANSTYSIMSGILNQNPNKTIVCPHEDSYFGKLKKHLDVSTLYPSDWVRIKF